MHFLLAAKLAWSNTTDDWNRLLVRCSGVTFAVILMFLQTGFRNALFDSNVRIMEEKIDADIVVRSASRFMLSSGQRMPTRHLDTIRSLPGVRSVEPLYIENIASEMRKPEFSSHKIRVMAFDVSSDSFSKFGLKEIAELLDEPNTAAADTKSKSMFGLPRNADELSATTFGELSGKQIRIVGLFESGINFSNDGSLIMTPRNFASYFPHRSNTGQSASVDYGIVRLEPDADSETAATAIQSILGPDVIVESRKQFLQSERDFWGKNTPIGLIFWVGTMIGFVVGLIICYQVLATDIGDHIGEFATLKAMGYSPLFFAQVVVVQALLLSLVSFLPGFLVALVAFQGVNAATGLVMFLNISRTATVLALTVSMCVISGFIALRKLLSTDPASLF